VTSFSSRLVGVLAEEKEVRRSGGRVVRGILRTVRTGVCELARPRRVDAREIDVGIDRAEHDTETDQHEQYHQPDKHGRVSTHIHVPSAAYRFADPLIQTTVFRHGDHC